MATKKNGKPQVPGMKTGQPVPKPKPTGGPSFPGVKLPGRRPPKGK